MMASMEFGRMISLEYSRIDRDNKGTPSTTIFGRPTADEE